MIDVKNLILKLEKNKINFFCGVPDSILKPFTNYIEQHKKNKHLICANEGGAIGIGVGNYLSSKKITCVYMQNSGLGNAVNPLVPNIIDCLSCFKFLALTNHSDFIFTYSPYPP